MKKIFAIAASALVLAAPAMSAQVEGPSPEAIVAYTAINSSTVGAIPLATNTLAPAGGMSWHLQYGRLSWGDDVNQSTYAGGINLSVGQGRLGVSAGYVTFDCQDCDSHATVGARYGVQLTGGALGLLLAVVGVAAITRLLSSTVDPPTARLSICRHIPE